MVSPEHVPIINDDTFENSTGTYMVLDESGNKTGETNEPADDYLFWDSIHPTTKAHQLVAIEVADNLSENDNDDSCFISTASVNSNSNIHITEMFGIFLIIGFSGFLLKQN